MAATSHPRFANKGGNENQEDQGSWSPESFAYQMLSSSTADLDATAWKTQVFEDVDEAIVRGKEWPHPPFYKFMPIFWNHDAHHFHLALNIVLSLYFVVLAVLRPQWLVGSFRVVGFPPGFLPFVLGFWALRFLLMALQLQMSRRFAVHDHTKEMLIRICAEAEEQEDVVPIEDEFFNAAAGTFCLHTVVDATLCCILLGWDGLVVFFCFFLPAIYLHVEERLCSMALRMAGLFSKCLVEDFFQRLFRLSTKSRDLGLWDLFKGATPHDVGIIHEPTDDNEGSDEQTQAGFWTSLIREHQDLMRSLIYVWLRAEIPFVLLLVQGVLFFFGMLVMAFISKNFVFQLTCACVAALHAMLVFVMDLLPSAQCTDMCISDSVGSRSIQTLSSRHFGREGMSPNVRREHANFMYYLAGTPCGIHLPFLGGVSMAETLGRVKIIATLLPVVVAHFALEARSADTPAAQAAEANATLIGSLNASWIFGF